MTKEQQQTYVEGGGLKCPWCDSNDLEGGDRTLDDSFMFHSISCARCGKKWTDVYTLTGVTAH